eukprot:8479694-Lingulodinium_polyedra.AAC.1
MASMAGAICVVRNAWSTMRCVMFDLRRCGMGVGPRIGGSCGEGWDGLIGGLTEGTHIAPLSISRLGLFVETGHMCESGGATPQVFFWMKNYGAASPKGTVLWGSLPYLQELACSCSRTDLRTPTALQITKRNSHGKCSGGKDLKSTQECPVMFGLSMALLHSEYKKTASDVVDVDSDSDSDMSWSAVEDLFPREP